MLGGNRREGAPLERPGCLFVWGLRRCNRTWTRWSHRKRRRDQSSERLVGG